MTSMFAPDPVRAQRYGAGAGVLAVAVVVAAIVFESLGPAPSDSAAEVARKFVESPAGVMAASYLLMAGVAMYVIFFTVLSGILRRAEGEPGRLSALTLVAGVASFVAHSAYVAIYASLAHSIARAAAAPLVYALFRVGTAIDSASGLFLGIALIAASILILRTGVFATWLGWLAAAAGLLGAVGAFALDDPTTVIGLLGLLGIILSLAWTLAISVVMWRRRLTGLRAP